MSIVTALRHLPPTTEQDPERIAERYREKEVVKRRLWSLYQNSSAIREFIDGNVAVFNGTKGDPRSFDLLDALLREQVYRISHWRVATEEINYRQVLRYQFPRRHQGGGPGRFRRNAPAGLLAGGSRKDQRLAD